MNWRFISHIFVKEGREILRDRRTLFVNVILPVLLYPLLALAFIQLNQVATTGPEDWTRIAIVDGDAELLDGLNTISEEAVSDPDKLEEELALIAEKEKKDKKEKTLAEAKKQANEEEEEVPKESENACRRQQQSAPNSGAY